jgi:hypothetical protein
MRINRQNNTIFVWTIINRHASDTRIGLMDSTVPIEAMLGYGKE